MYNSKQRQGHCEQNSLFDTNQNHDCRCYYRKPEFARTFTADGAQAPPIDESDGDGKHHGSRAHIAAGISGCGQKEKHPPPLP